MVARENRLRTALAELESRSDPFDYVFIDCPPSLGLLTINALVAAPEVLIPIQCEYYALEGVGQLLHNIELVKAHLNPGLDVTTVILTMYDGRTKLADQVADEVRRYFGAKVLKTVIPRSVKVSEAPGYGMTIIEYDPGSRGAMSYLDASREIAERGVDRQPTRREITDEPTDAQEGRAWPRPGFADSDRPRRRGDRPGGTLRPADRRCGGRCSDGRPAAARPRSDIGAVYREIEPTQIEPNPRQPRQVFDEEALAELVHSIREFGLMQPIVVRDARRDARSRATNSSWGSGGGARPRRRA